MQLTKVYPKYYKDLILMRCVLFVPFNITILTVDHNCHSKNAVVVQETSLLFTGTLEKIK